MENQVFGIKIKVSESGVLRDNPGREPHAIKPIPKDEGALFGRFGKETDKRQARKSPSPGLSKAKDLGDEVHCCFSDMKNSSSFELYDKAGDLVVKAMSPDTKEVIRETNSEDLPKPREKSEKLRGVLFARKA
jgi:uncharacterized FlaG/YvyC family protein